MQTPPSSATAASTAEEGVPPLPLPLGADDFPDEALAIVCRFLGPIDLGRLACVSRRFTERTLRELTAAEDEGGGGALLLSPIEEGARLRLAAAAAAASDSGGWAPTKNGQSTWLRALWYAECRLVFKSCGPKVVLSENGASWSLPACARDCLLPARLGGAGRR